MADHDTHDHTGIPGCGGSGGYTELDYVEFTSTVNITATTEATANTIVTSSAVAYSGSQIVLIEYWFPFYTAPLSLNIDMALVLYDGSSSIGFLGLISTPTNGNSQRVVPYGARRLTPSAATHTYSIRGALLGGSGTGVIGAGAGGSGNHNPGFIRITQVG